MKLYVNVKQAGSRKNYISKEEINLNFTPATLRELIRGIVSKNVMDFNEKLKKDELIDYLTAEGIEKALDSGKLSFGEIHNKTEAKLGKALEAAFLAYEDGIYRVFIGDTEAAGLDDSLDLKEGEVLTFIRLTMLAGRMW